MKTKPKRGAILLLTTILLFVLLGMVVSLSYVTVMEQKMSGKTKSSVGSFYSAESGVEWTLNKIANPTGTTIADTFGSARFNSDYSVKCPDTFGTDVCKIFLLDQDGKVITNSNADLSLVKAVRSVGNQGGDTQRAIEAAVAAASGASFTYYCNLSSDVLPTPPNICTNAGGTQGYCPSGFKQIADLGSWGGCSGGAPAIFRPPGGGCPSGWNVYTGGEAYVCSQ